MKTMHYGLLLAALGLLIGNGARADEMATESRAIDARVVRVVLDGVIDLKVRRGDTPSLAITADKRLLPSISSVQSGDTLRLDMDGGTFKLNRVVVRAELTLPALREVASEGVGTTEVSGFSGDQLVITLDGAGSMKVMADYRRVRAALGGVGSLQISTGQSDSVELDLHGAGGITLSGRSRLLKASLGGVGGLNAQQFQADAVDVDLSGLGGATVTAHQSATLNLSGLGSVTVFGKPQNRSVSVNGLGKVNWK